MKLINKTIFYYLLICIPLMLLAAINSYYVIKGEIEEVSDENIGLEVMHAQGLIQGFDKPKEIQLGFGGLSSVKMTVSHKNDFVWSDTAIYNSYDNEYEGYRMIKSHFNYNNQTYLITVIKPTIEEEELIEGLFSSFIVILVFLILAFFLVSWLLSKTLWRPFYKTLQQLNQYDIKNHSVADFETSSTKEFKQLNESLNKMTDKIYEDYLQQKEFTENASHEMQTPLAVIKANIGLLMQSPNLKEEEMDQIETIDNTVKKLSSLNKALLLLSKIDNHQFKDETQISVADSCNKIIDNYQNLIDSKHLTLKTKFRSDIQLKCNHDLIDILLTNLIQNAIRHNYTNGLIEIEIESNAITITNTGEPLTIKEHELFMRFKKNNASTESLGLGLSIVKSICDNYGYRVSYEFNKKKHSFSIHFI